MAQAMHTARSLPPLGLGSKPFQAIAAGAMLTLAALTRSSRYTGITADNFDVWHPDCRHLAQELHSTLGRQNFQLSHHNRKIADTMVDYL